jgi:VWFA-related protein
MMRQTLLTSFFVVLAGSRMAGQAVGQNKAAASDTPTFTVSRSLVIETVRVNDKNGNPVEGLTAKDFTVTEDGAAQEIKFFEFEKLEEMIKDAAPLPPVGAPVYFKKLPSTQIASEVPGQTQYKDKRLLAMYFDMSSMPVPDQIRALGAAQKFIKTQMTPADLVAIMQYTGASVQVAQDFTNDRERLLGIIQTMIVGDGDGFDGTTSDASASDTGAAFGQDDSEFNIFNTDRQLSALQTAAKMLGHLNEKKALIYFASGLTLRGLDNQAQLHATVNAAVRAGVQFWPIDARGLVASAPLGDATKGAPGGSGMYTGSSALAFSSNFSQSQDTMYTIAADTGGKALLDNNDLSAGVVKAQKSFSSYYIIGYYPTNEALNGKFRRVKIALNNGATASLDYTQGYYAGKVFAKFTAADKERQLEDALMLGDPITELTIAMEVDYFQLNRAEYFVPIMVKIPGSELALARKGGAERTLIDFITEVKDDFGTTIQNVRDKADIKLSDSTAAELAKRRIQYPTGFTLLPGKYVIKFLARDAETGRIGTFQTKIVIPNLNREEKHIPISSVVLSSQRVDLKDAIYNANKDKDKSEVADPLVVDGQKLIPSVTRVFSTSKDMYVYLQAYQPSAAAVQPLVAFVTFYRGQTKTFETPPLLVTAGLNNKLRTVPLKFDLSLSKLPPGEYNCQVTVLDPTGQKTAFWQAPVMLIP